MSEKIEPALSADEWDRAVIRVDGRLGRHIIKRGACEYRLFAGQLEAWNEASKRWDIIVSKPTIIALANAALPDSDPRKITREMVGIIREAGKRIGREGNQYLGFEKNLLVYADALESYLPPES